MQNPTQLIVSPLTNYYIQYQHISWQLGLPLPVNMLPSLTSIGDSVVRPVLTVDCFSTAELAYIKSAYHMHTKIRYDMKSIIKRIKRKKSNNSNVVYDERETYIDNKTKYQMHCFGTREMRRCLRLPKSSSAIVTHMNFHSMCTEVDDQAFVSYNNLREVVMNEPEEDWEIFI